MICLDIETLDFISDPAIKSLPRDQQIAAIRFGIAVTYKDDDWREWLPDQLPALWDYLQGDILGGWNIRAFDLPVIHHSLNRMHRQIEPATFATDDLFDRIRQATGRWYKLEDVAQANLSRGKSADGQQAALWLREWEQTGQAAPMRKVLDYCRLDVELEKSLYDWLADGKPLRLPPRAARQELNEILFWGDGRVERVPDALGTVGTR